MDNPLISRGAVPDFAAIKPEHFMPAMNQALASARLKFGWMRSDTLPATFENTVVPLESLFEEAADIVAILRNCENNMAPKALRPVKAEAENAILDLKAAVFQDATLGARFRTVYAQPQDKLDADDKALLRCLHHAFEESGALLESEEDRQKLRALDKRLIILAQKFRENAMEGADQQAVLITDGAELAGLSAAEISNLAENAREKKHTYGWLVTPERLMVDDLLQRAEHPAFRKKIFEALNRTGTQEPFDNRPVIKDMIEARDAYAKMLGYPHFAGFARARAMRSDLEETCLFMQDVAGKALPKFEDDMRKLEAFAKAGGGPDRLEPQDVPYWYARQRNALYDFDAGAFTQHLQLDHVMEGLFSEAALVPGLSFRELQGQSAMHPDTRVYAVTDTKTGADLGLLHVDPFSRPGQKIEGAWMEQIQRAAPGRPNIIIFNMNLLKPPAGKPALLGLGQYGTLYHEAGHGFHGLIGNNVKYRSLSGIGDEIQGTGAPADFVEIFSMINEHRAVLKLNLQKHALHAVTGLPPDDSVIDALIASKAHFEEGRLLLRLVQNSLRDIGIHSIDPKNYKGVEALHDAVAFDSPYAAHVRAYPLTRFTHLFNDARGSYAAGYVNYLTAQEHAAHGFGPFRADPYDTGAAARLSAFYGGGSGGEFKARYRAYRGEDATPDAMLRDADVPVGGKNLTGQVARGNKNSF